MDLLTYLTTPAAAGTPEYIFLVAQVVVALVGAYLALLHADAHPVRGPALRRLGQALLVVGLLGAVVGALRTSGIEPFTAPVWITVATVLNLALIGFVLYYAQTVYPRQVAAHEQASRSRGGAKTFQPRPATTRQPRLSVPNQTDSQNGDATLQANGVSRPPSGRRASRRYAG